MLSLVIFVGLINLALVLLAKSKGAKLVVLALISLQAVMLLLGFPLEIS